MRILLLTHAFNSLTQRLFVELADRGHSVSVEFDITDSVTLEAVALFRPDVVVAPFLKRAIPETVWRKLPCLIVHPGPRGDRGPAALDHAILEDHKRWGVTVLLAEAVMDAGPVLASADFPMRAAPKSSLYRHEVTEGAVAGVLAALERLERGTAAPEVLMDLSGWKPTLRQEDRAINWSVDTTATVLRKIRAADGRPGVLDHLFGEPVYLYDAQEETRLTGNPGAVIAKQETALCRATVDGAVWIGHVRRKEAALSIKLPTMLAFAEHENTVPPPPEQDTYWRDLWYEERNGVGFLHFPFYNGAMSTRQCERLTQALVAAKARPTQVIVLMGGPDFWSNGMHLNVIEAAESPADESWRNINAINDLVREIITTTDRLTIASLHGNAGAGGVFLALACDHVWARAGIILNPHYKGMGNLHGSEYWTYLLPRRVGPMLAEQVTAARLPIGTKEARRLGLIDEAIAGDVATFRAETETRAMALAADPALAVLIEEKRRTRATDEAVKPLAAYRALELDRMKLNFYGFDPSYHVARYNFVFGVQKSHTPLVIARHRRRI
ncbi:MAG: hydrogenase maturation protein [Alphaproteobacteria bacterium]|nr:hydrogenase maturation protein [Alphaproteobacteria bacterium]